MKSVSRILFSIQNLKKVRFIKIKVIECYIDKISLINIREVLDLMILNGAYIDILENKKIDYSMRDYQCSKISPFKSPDYSSKRIPLQQRSTYEVACSGSVSHKGQHTIKLIKK